MPNAKNFQSGFGGKRKVPFIDCFDCLKVDVDDDDEEDK